MAVANLTMSHPPRWVPIFNRPQNGFLGADDGVWCVHNDTKRFDRAGKGNSKKFYCISHNELTKQVKSDLGTVATFVAASANNRSRGSTRA